MIVGNKFKMYNSFKNEYKYTEMIKIINNMHLYCTFYIRFKINNLEVLSVF